MALTLTLPLGVASNGSLGTLVQGSPEELAQSIGLLVSTRPGERRAEPGYGLVDPIGTGLRPDVVTAAIADWEDRARDVDVEVIGKIVQAATIRASSPNGGTA